MVKVLQQNTWIDDRKFLKSCVRARAEQGNINHPAYGTWTADSMLQQNESKAFLGKDLNDLCVPWRHRRREMMAIADIIPVAKLLAKIKQRSDVGCRLCKSLRAREQHGASTEKLLSTIHSGVQTDRNILYIHIYVCMNIYVCIYTCVCTYVYTYMYIYINTYI